jgi:hypothetical protein
MNEDFGRIELANNIGVEAWLDRVQDVVCVKVRHLEGRTKRGGLFKVSLEALHRVHEAHEYPVLALMTPDTDALFE